MSHHYHNISHMICGCAAPCCAVQGFPDYHMFVAETGMNRWVRNESLKQRYQVRHLWEWYAGRVGAT